MKFILKILVNSLAVYITAQIVPGVSVDSFVTAGLVAIVFGTLNTFLKPVLILLTLPITIITLGLFTLVINLGILLLTDYLVAGFELQSFLYALLFGFVLSLVSSFLGLIAR